MKFLLALLMMLSFSQAHSYEGDLSAEEAYTMQKDGEAIIVDVRTTLEFIYTGHGEGFINIPAYYWTYDEKPIETRVKSADYEVKNSKVKDHVAAMKLYNAKEVANKNFIKEVMEAMKMQNVTKVILVCRSGPRSTAAAEILAQEGISAYNLEDGFTFGWKDANMPWGGQ
ncbi:MAG: rhodanese-like domain-containing protein [Sulfurimonadaceae bacterium]|jgi:rhodanese-related sulfurtransferase|nr:rhodanese-like domain-containing protein [Sulfurimonadaceae bacterium]